MKGRKKMLLIECFPDVRFSAKALFFYFTHTSKFLLNDTVVTNCRSQNWRALREWLFDLDATKLVSLILGFGIFYSQLKRQEFLLLFCSFKVICARSTQELEMEGIEPRSVWLKRTHFFSNSFNKYYWALTTCQAWLWAPEREQWTKQNLYSHYSKAKWSFKLGSGP